MPLKTAIVVNIRSGKKSGYDTINEIKQACAANNITADFLSVHNGSEIKFRVTKAMEDGYNCIVAAGGDGTINTVASVLVGTNVVLGIIPVGTFNHLAQDLNIPMDISLSVKVLADGKNAKIDVGVVNDNIFVNNASIGLYPSLVFLREQRQKLGWSKSSALAWAFIEIFKRYSFSIVHLKFEGREVLRKTPFVFIGNNNYHIEGVNIGSRSSISEGKLSIYVAHRPGRLQLLRTALAAVFKQLQNNSTIDSFETTKLVIETRKKTIRIALDGEIQVLSTPLYFSSKPASLLVQIPEEVNNL